jgi:hypothetical protein
MLPIVVSGLRQAVDHFRGVDFDGQLAPAIEAAGRQIDRADDSAGMVREQNLSMKLQVLQLVDLDSNVIHDAEASNPFDELLNL